MNVDIERELHSEHSNGIPKSNINSEQKNKLMSDEELSFANSKVYRNNEENKWSSKISDNAVLIVNCGSGEKLRGKISRKHAEDESKFEKICDEEFRTDSGGFVKELDVKTPEKDIDNNKKYQMSSNDEFLKETGCTVNESKEKLHKKQAPEEPKFGTTVNKEFLEEADRANIELNGKYLDKCEDKEKKPQRITDEESSMVNCGTEKEPNEKSSKPQVILTEEPPEKKADIFDIVGSDGLWQRCMFIWKFCFAIPTAFHYMVMTFFAPDIDYWCAKPADVNWTINEWKTHGLTDDKCYFRYENITKQFPTENLTLKASDIATCNAWEYDTSFYTSTVISQWDLVCGREWLASFSLSMFNIGTLISNLVIGHLADVLGRKRMILVCLNIAVISAIICAFSISYPMFVLTRFLTAFGLSGVFNVSYVLLLEITGPKERPFYGVAMHLGWCVGFISLPGVAYLLRDWFWIEIAITVPCILLLLTCWILSESPRWLMVKGRIEEAEKILIKSAKINGREISNLDGKLRTVMDNAQKAYKPSEASRGFVDLLSSGLWRSTLNIWFLWFVTSFTYLGLSYTTNALAGNPFVNFALSGFVEVPGTILTTFVIHYLGRMKPLAFTMIFGGIACLLMYVVPEDPWWIGTAVSMTGKFSVTVAINIAYICTAEIFPTVVRNVGLGSASFFARLGAVLAPFVKELGNATHPVVPQIVFGVLGCISGALIFLLPETKDLNVPETLERKGPTKNKDTENIQADSEI